MGLPRLGCELKPGKASGPQELLAPPWLLWCVCGVCEGGMYGVWVCMC